MANETIWGDGDVLQFVQKLIAATRAGKIEWETIELDDVYQAIFKSGVVLIRKGLGYFLEIVNPSGANVLTFAPEEESEQQLLEQLFDLARDSALKPQQVLHDIVREIDEQLLHKG